MATKQTRSDLEVGFTSMYALTNSIIYNGISTEFGKTVLIEDSHIKAIVSPHEIPTDCPTHDLRGMNLAPGFLDLQIYGGGGSLFNTDISEETIRKTVEAQRKTGTTGLQITLSSMSFEAMMQSIEVAKAYQHNSGKGLLGLHLEGPYFSMEKRGAHVAKYIRKATTHELEQIIEASEGLLTYMTLAPEQQDEDCLDLLLNSHIKLSLGHSSATYKQAKAAFAKGFKRVTHLFNAMTAFQSREPGIVGATYDSEAWASIIADGIHCDFASVRISKQLMQERLFLITDAVTEDTRGDYRFHFNQDRFTDDNGILSGSALTMIKAIQNCVEQVGIPLEEALRMATLYPARVIDQAHTLGRIAPNYVADLVIFNQNFEVKGIIEQGESTFF